MASHHCSKKMNMSGLPDGACACSKGILGPVVSVRKKNVIALPPACSRVSKFVFASAASLNDTSKERRNQRRMKKTTTSSFNPEDQGIDLLTTSTTSANYVNYYWWDNHNHYPYGWYGYGTCPTCGHCPTCGRGGHVHPTYPYYPSYPVWYNNGAAVGAGNAIFQISY